MAPNLKCAHLLIVILNLLEEKVMHRITECLDQRLLDRALNDMMEAGQFPKWFSDAFYFNPLYGQLGGLRGYLFVASGNGLLRLDGTNFNYHLELSETVINWLVGEIGMDRKEIQAIAHELNDELTRLLSERQTPLR